METQPNRLRHHRQERLLTQQELAALSGCHHITISRIELGDRRGNWKTRKLLARALEVPESELFPHALAA